MELEAGDAGLPPFFAAVRRRHPDVDIVLLAPDPPAATTEGADRAQVEESLRRTIAVAAEGWLAATDRDDEPEARLGFGPDPTSVVARVRSTTTFEESPLPDLAARLARQGWRLGYLPGAAERLIARRDDVDLLVSYASVTGAFVLTATSRPLQVGRARARELVRR
jgi:hypothetical protein